MAARHWEQNKEATVYVGNLDERFSEPLMWEIMTQMGPVVNVHMPMDRVSRIHQGFGFVEFDTPESADYTARCLNGVRLYGKPVRINKASADRQRATDIGAELFVNNLDPQVDEKILYDTFAQFGVLVAAPNVVRDQNNVSKGYGFVNYDSFEASDAARAAMHGQYLLNKQIAVEYAYKKDGKGERHGDDAERKLAAEGKKHNVVPDIQPLPPAFLMKSGAPPGSMGAPPSGLNGVNGFDGLDSVNGVNGALHGVPPSGPNAAPLGAPVGGAGLGAPPPATGGYGGRGGYQGQLPRGGGYGRGRGGSGGPGLPMAPSGLPQRPGGFRGGYGQQQQPPQQSFNGMPPPSFNNGSMPPPGFAPQGPGGNQYQNTAPGFRR